MKKVAVKETRKNVNQYPVIVQADQTGGYWVFCPLFQGCYSQGETVDEALENIKEAIALCSDENGKQEKVGDVSLHLVRV